MSKGKRKPYHPDYDPRAEPLVKACAEGNLKKVRQLVETGIPVNAIGSKHWGYYPLHAAAENGRDDIVKYLIRAGAKLEVRTAMEFQRELMTPLLLAGEKNHFDTVKILVEKGADVNAHSDYNNTPLGWATQRRNREMFDYLFAHGARAEVRHFNLAVGTGDKGLVQWFLDQGFKLDAEEFEMGQSHLSKAIARKNFDMVKFLVEHGANVNRAWNDFAEPPLVQATAVAEWEIAKYLIEHGADPNLGSIHKAYPLNYAARRGGLECAALLLEKGAKVNSVDFGKMTPLEWAVEQKDKPILELLVKHGAIVPKKLVPTIIRRFRKAVLKNATITSKREKEGAKQY